MGVEKVNPGEPWARLSFDPGHGFVDDGVGGALDEDFGGGVLGPVIVIIGVEALRQAEPGIERKGPDKGAGGVAGPLEELGERLELARDDEIGVVMNAVGRRRQPEEDVGVRWQCDGIVGEGMREAGAPPRQPVDRRRPRGPAPVAAQPVRPERVHRDQERVQGRLGPDGGRRSRTGRAGQHGADDEEEDQSHRRDETFFQGKGLPGLPLF